MTTPASGEPPEVTVPVIWTSISVQATAETSALSSLSTMFGLFAWAFVTVRTTK